jgi:hypothetical protein
MGVALGASSGGADLVVVSADGPRLGAATFDASGDDAPQAPTNRAVAAISVDRLASEVEPIACTL